MSDREIAEPNTILRGLVGSTVHGLNVPGKDDRDEMGVCIEPREYVIGLKHFEQWIYRTQPEGVTSFPFAQYVKHQWAGAWMCSCFRNESSILSSVLIQEAVAATRWKYGDPPELGMVTFVDPTKVRRKRDWGRCYLKAGFVPCGQTKGGLYALQLLPDAMPPACEPIGSMRNEEFDFASTAR